MKLQTVLGGSILVLIALYLFVNFKTSLGWYQYMSPSDYVYDLRRSNDVCPKENEAHRMCSDLAGSYGIIPSYADNECWIQSYQTCLNRHGNTKNAECKCSQWANEKCYKASSPPDTIYQKCMATQGYAHDPDR